MHIYTMCNIGIIHTYIYIIYIYIYISSGHKWSATHRVLKSYRRKMGIIYMLSYIYIYIYIYIFVQKTSKTGHPYPSIHLWVDTHSQLTPIINFSNSQIIIFTKVLILKIGPLHHWYKGNSSYWNLPIQDSN